MNTYFDLLPFDLLVEVVSGLNTAEFFNLDDLLKFSSEFVVELIKKRFRQFYVPTYPMGIWEEIYLGLVYFNGDINVISDYMVNIFVISGGDIVHRSNAEHKREEIPRFVFRFLKYLIDIGSIRDNNVISIILAVEGTIEEVISFFEGIGGVVEKSKVKALMNIDRIDERLKAKVLMNIVRIAMSDIEQINIELIDALIDLSSGGNTKYEHRLKSDIYGNIKETNSEMIDHLLTLNFFSERDKKHIVSLREKYSK